MKWRLRALFRSILWYSLRMTNLVVGTVGLISTALLIALLIYDQKMPLKEKHVEWASRKIFRSRDGYSHYAAWLHFTLSRVVFFFLVIISIFSVIFVFDLK